VSSTGPEVRRDQVIAADPATDDLPRPPRSIPPRFVDLVLLAWVAVAYAGYVFSQVFVHTVGTHTAIGPAVWTTRSILAVVCFPSVIALWWRRRYPLHVLGIALFVLLVAYNYPFPFALVALFTAASRSRLRDAIIGWVATAAVIVVGRGTSSGWSSSFEHDVVSSLTGTAAVTGLGMYIGARRAYLDRLRERALFAKALAAFLPSDVARIVQRSPSSLSLDQEVEATVLFSDVRGFSTMAEQLQPRDVAEIMGHHLSAMAAVVVANGGTIDKFVGDGVMAVFGAPNPMHDHAERSLRCAVEMQQRQSELNTSGSEHGVPQLQMGIGINTGQVIAGTVGGSGRLEYTVFGDAVNVAQRLQAEAGPGEILVSDATAHLVPDVAFVGVGPRLLKGRGHAVDVLSAPW